MTAPAYSNFFVSHASGASPVNGGGPRLGANDGPVYTTADATVAAGSTTTITDNTGTPWNGCQADDWVCWDTGGAKEFRRIVSIAGAAATVSAACTPGANKAVNVCGAWGCAQTAATNITTAFVNAAGNWPCIWLPSGTTFNEYITWANAGTSAIPLTIAGYTTTPGDIDPLTSSVRTPMYPVVLTITAATATNPCVVTVGSGHNFGVGQVVKIASCAGGTWSTLNGDRTITAMDSTTITFGAVDASGYGTYTASSGTASPWSGSPAAVICSNAAYQRLFNLDVSSTTASMYGIGCAASSPVVINCKAKAVSYVFIILNSIAYPVVHRCYFDCSICTSTTGAVVFSQVPGVLSNSIITGMTVGYGLRLNAGGGSVVGNLIYGNLIGVSTNNTVLTAYDFRNNIVADNLLNGIDFGTAVALPNAIHDNIIAYNGTTNTGASLTAASPSVLTIAGQTTRYASGTCCTLGGITNVTNLTNGTRYFLQQSAGSSPNWTYTVRATAAGSNINTGGSADSGTITVKVGFGIASSGTTPASGAYSISLFDYNSIYGNAIADIQTNGASADGAVTLLDTSLHNDTTHAPFTGASAAARAANYYAMTADVKGIHQYFADTNYSTYPDLGALQALGYAYGDDDASKVLTTAAAAGTYQPVATVDVRYGTAVGVSPAVGSLYGDTNPTKVLDDADTPGTYKAIGTDYALHTGSGYFGANSAVDGNYVPVATGDVRNGVPVGVSPAEGTLVSASEEDVRAGVAYGSGSEYLGTLVGVVELDGTLHATGLFDGTNYHATGLFDGTNYHATTGLTVTDVALGVTWYDGDGSHEGTLECSGSSGATLATTTLTPDGDGAGSGATAVPGATFCTGVDEGTATPDDDDYIQFEGSNSYKALRLSNTPTDCQTVVGCRAVVRHAYDTGGAERMIAVAIMESDLATHLTADYTPTNRTTPTTDTMTMVLDGETDKTHWDDAYIVISCDDDGGASGWVRVYTVEVEIDYISSNSGLVLTYYAYYYDSGTPTGKTGDVSNHTLRLIRDGVSVSPTNAATESTSADGLYQVELTYAEAQSASLSLAVTSSTSGVHVFPVANYPAAQAMLASRDVKAMLRGIVVIDGDHASTTTSCYLSMPIRTNLNKQYMRIDTGDSSGTSVRITAATESGTLMSVTFTPALSAALEGGDEVTIGGYRG